MKLGVILLFGVFFSGNAWSEDVSALQTAVRIAKDEMDKAQKERDAIDHRVADEEKELAKLKEQLETDKKRAVEFSNRYVESKKKYDKAQAALEKAWK